MFIKAYFWRWTGVWWSSQLDQNSDGCDHVSSSRCDSEGCCVHHVQLLHTANTTDLFRAADDWITWAFLTLRCLIACFKIQRCDIISHYVSYGSWEVSNYQLSVYKEPKHRLWNTSCHLWSEQFQRFHFTITSITCWFNESGSWIKLS